MSQPHPYVCPSYFAGSLDNFLRRMIHKPARILKDYVKGGMTVLDMGCGPGYFTVELAKLVGEEGKVIAADLQQEMLDKMVIKVKQKGLEKRVEPHLCQSESTGITKKVDFILAFWMIHEVPDQDKLIGEFKSLLNSDGKILIAEPKFHVAHKAFEEMLLKVEAAGFEVAGSPKIAISRAVLVKHKL